MRHASKLLALAAVALIGSAEVFAQAPPVLEFAVTTTSDGQSVIPRITWATTPAAAVCTASGAQDWNGNKAPGGAEQLAPIVETRSYTLQCAWAENLVVRLTWKAPTAFTDGSPLVAATDLGGYRIEYGLSEGNLDQGTYLQEPLALSWTSPQLAPADWFFTVRAYGKTGLESQRSVPIIKKTVSAAAGQTRTIQGAVKFPGVPTDVAAE